MYVFLRQSGLTNILFNSVISAFLLMHVACGITSVCHSLELSKCIINLNHWFIVYHYLNLQDMDNGEHEGLEETMSKGSNLVDPIDLQRPLLGTVWYSDARSIYIFTASFRLGTSFLNMIQVADSKLRVAKSTSLLDLKRSHSNQFGTTLRNIWKRADLIHKGEKLREEIQRENTKTTMKCQFCNTSLSRR